MIANFRKENCSVQQLRKRNQKESLHVLPVHSCSTANVCLSYDVQLAVVGEHCRHTKPFVMQAWQVDPLGAAKLVLNKDARAAVTRMATGHKTLLPFTDTRELDCCWQIGYLLPRGRKQAKVNAAE